MPLQLFVYGYAIMEALEMERPMTEWNDERLDEMNERMKDGFAEVDKRFARLEGEMKESFAKAAEERKTSFEKVDCDLKEGFGQIRSEVRWFADRMDKRFEQVNARVDRVMYTLMATGLGLVAAVLTGGLN